MADKLQQGISIIYNMELNDYLMDKCIKDLNYKISNLGFLRGVGSMPQKGEINLWWDDIAPIAILVCGLIGAIVGIITGFRDNDGFFDTLIGVVVGFFLYALIGAAVGAVSGTIIYFVMRSKKQLEIDKSYKRSMDLYNDGLEKAKARQRIEEKEKQILIKQRDSLIVRRKEAKNKLINFYNIMDIDVNYRSLIPIGYMDEFIRLGISNQLSGVNGLYYLVRQEMRGDRLQYSLDEISRKLDEIISNQHQIYYEITDMNNKCIQLINQATKAAEVSAKNNQLLNAAVANTSIAAYNSQRIKEELKFQNFMYIYNS